MSRIDKAVILAAGAGSRLKGEGGVPKPLLPLSGEPGSDTFLDWHLRALSRVGCERIYLVGNAVTFGTRLNAMDEVPATWILNPTEDLSRSGSGHSAAIAFESPHDILDGRSRVLLMDADVLYDPRLLERLASSDGPRSKDLISAGHEDTSEEVLVFARPTAPELPVRHGKGLLGTPLVERLVCLGEATGLVLFEPGDHEALRAVTDWTLRYSTAKTRSEHEDLTQHLMALGRIEAVCFSEEPFLEVDTPEEVARMRREVLPGLLAARASRDDARDRLSRGEETSS